MKHLDFNETAATCSVCELTVDLPQGLKDPPPQRVRIGEAWVERTRSKTRPDGSEGIELAPWADALVDFYIAHAHGAPTPGRPAR